MNAIALDGIARRHAFRPDDASRTTDVFKHITCVYNGANLQDNHPIRVTCDVKEPGLRTIRVSTCRRAACTLTTWICF